jgi:hypothetical protein
VSDGSDTGIRDNAGSAGMGVGSSIGSSHHKIDQTEDPT